MKHIKLLLAILGISILVTGCYATDLPDEETVILDDTEFLSDKDSVNEIDSKNNTISTKTTYKFMLDDKLFVDTGEIEHGATCGVMDRNFEEVIPSDQIPTKNGQVNFDGSYGSQFGRRQNRMTAIVDDECHIFAYNENSYDGIEMKVKEATPSKLIIELSNKLRKELTYGEDYIIEFYDAEIDQWLPVDEIIDNAAFNSVGHILPPAETTEVSVDFEWLYGTLKAGKYRIVKDILDVTEPGVYDQYWYMAEFTIK